MSANEQLCSELRPARPLLLLAGHHHASDKGAPPLLRKEKLRRRFIDSGAAIACSVDRRSLVLFTWKEPPVPARYCGSTKQPRQEESVARRFRHHVPRPRQEVVDDLSV